MGVIKGDTRSLERGSHKDDEEICCAFVGGKRIGNMCLFKSVIP